MRILYDIKIFFLILFVFSIPFEYWDPLGIAHFFTVTKFAGLLYFVFSLFDVKNNFTIKYIKTSVFILLYLWLFLLIQGIVNYWYGTTLSVFNFTFFQNIILFWLISNDLNRNPNIVKKIFLSLVISVFAMATLASLGVGLNTEIDSELGSYRLTFFGSNSNTIGNLASISLLFVLAMVINKRDYYGKKTLLLTLSIPSLISILSLSGSRGALFISFIGVVVLLVFQKVSLNRKLILLLVGSVFIFLAINEIMETEVMQRRISLTTSEGSIGGRDIIWKHALDIFYENPFIGVGNTGYQKEIIQRYGMYLDTHNLFLYFMVTGGIVALSLYMAFLFQLFQVSRIFFKYKNDVLLYAILVVYVFSVFKSGGAINSKLSWLLIAIVSGLGVHHKAAANTKIFNKILDNDKANKKNFPFNI